MTHVPVSWKRAHNFKLPGIRSLNSQTAELRGTISTDWPNPQEELPLSRLVVANTEHCSAQIERVNFGYTPPSRGINYYALNAGSSAHHLYVMNTPWDSRLYANAYAKFVDAARQGSAEWGMNMVQARKSLQTFIQLSTTSATVIAAFVRSNQRGLQWLQNHRHYSLDRVHRERAATDRSLRLARNKADRRRLSNKLWLLDQVSGTLLAYRYGVAPIMKDLFTTASLMSSEYEDNVSLRKSHSRPWAIKDVAVVLDGKTHILESTIKGMERAVLKADVSVSNPNLLLANRLGLINPQLWVWDAIPWSFVVDWWFPIGQFLGAFTALVGLKLEGASVTRTMSYTAKWGVLPQSAAPRCVDTITYFGDRILFGKYKSRTTGSLPIPLSVPYGTGLGIQRGQNALALCAQLLSKKVKLK